MQLMEIEEPVEDQKGYVYEKHDVVYYINSNGGSVKCPSSGKFGMFYCVTAALLSVRMLLGACTLSVMLILLHGRAATQHMITIPELKRAHKLIRQQKHQRIHGTQRQSQDDVVDVDD